MTVRILGKNEGEVPLSSGLFTLEESQTYAILGVPRHANVSLGSVRLEWDPVTASFTLPIGYWVGTQELRIQEGESTRSIPVRVDPRTDKLSAAEWMVMLQELESWMPGGSVGREGGTLGTMSEGVPAPMVAVALGPLIPVLVNALRVIAEQPKSRRIELEHDVSLHAVRKVGTDTLRWLARKPEVMAAVDPWAVVRQGPRNPLVPQFLAEDSVDHPVNRYIAWAVARVTAQLRATAQSLERAAKDAGSFSDSSAWYSARAAELSSGAEALASFLRSSFLRQVPPEPPSESAILVAWQPTRGEPRWLILDAKYRVSRRAVEDAFETVHIYRDSLVWTTMGGRCQTVWLLVPAVLEECRPWAEPEFTRRFGSGLRRLAPGSTGDDSLGAEVLAALKVL